MSVKKRGYTSEIRQVQAEKTKQNILSAAKKLFEKKGFEKVKIEDIAKTAKVSVSSVFAIFQSKRGVLKEIMDSALAAEQHEVLVQQVKMETSPRKRLALAAAISRQLYDAEKKQLNLLRSVAILGHEFKELELEQERRRYERQEETIKVMAREKVFARNLSLTKVRDILWAFTGRDLYRMLVIEKNWSSNEYEQWLAQTLARLLLQD